jgi:hypothetical protein
MSGLTGVVYAPYVPTQPMNGAQAMPQVPSRPLYFRKTARIDQLTQQDSLTLTRSVKRVPLTNPLTKAWLTIKSSENANDPGDLQLIITTAVQAAGQITDDGHTSGVGQLKFTATPAQMGALPTQQSLVYDIQILHQDGTLWTAEKGTVLLDARVTAAVS